VGVPPRACVQCGQAMDPDARFCNGCGQPAPAPDSFAPTGTMVAPGRTDPGHPGPQPDGPAWPSKDSYQPTQYQPAQDQPAQDRVAQYQPVQDQPAQYQPTQAAPDLRPRPFAPPAGQYSPPAAGYQPAPAGYQPAPAAYQPPPPPEHYPPSPSEFQPLPGELPPVPGDYQAPRGQSDFANWFQDRPPRSSNPDAPGPGPDYADPAFSGMLGPPGGPPPGSGRPPGSRRPVALLLTVVVAAVLAAAVAFVLLRNSHDNAAATGASQSSSAPASSASASSGQGSEQQAATRLAGLLSQSGHDRSSISTAYDDVDACGPQLDQDAQTFSSAATGRQQLLTQLSTMPGRSALPAGMLQTLTTAWQASITADQDYSQWAQDEASGTCKKNDHTDPHFVAANAPDVRATAQKEVFLGQWNPIAAKYGLPTYKWYQI
jgi:hypothetical protein